jgi:predicted GH43/DUF377 family glycosyl hydrolase
LSDFQKKGVISAPLSYREVAEICRQSYSPIYEYYATNYHGLSEYEDLLVYEKDALLFPRKINGKFALVHRILPAIQVIYFDDFTDLTPEYWHEYLTTIEQHTILQPSHPFENKHIGGGCPPIETEAGWLFIYHSVEQTAHGRVYHAAAALLDLRNPSRVIGQLDVPLFSPEHDWEKSGDVNNVVFPSGAVVDGNELHIYYGAADSCIGAKTVDLPELLAALKGEAPAPEEPAERQAGDFLDFGLAGGAA